MKKLLLIILLTFTTTANADDSRYTMASNEEDGDFSYVWILDAEKGKLKYCWKWGQSFEGGIGCSKWQDLNDDED